jgi:hypothetical protein
MKDMAGGFRIIDRMRRSRRLSIVREAAVEWRIVAKAASLQSCRAALQFPGK